jgi:hypothetical protein
MSKPWTTWSDGAATRIFFQIFTEITFISAVGNSTFLKSYTLPDHTITIGLFIIETKRSSLLYCCGASTRPKGPMQWMSAVIKNKFSILYV